MSSAPVYDSNDNKGWEAWTDLLNYFMKNKYKSTENHISKAYQKERRAPK